MIPYSVALLMGGGIVLITGSITVLNLAVLKDCEPSCDMQRIIGVELRLVPGLENRELLLMWSDCHHLAFRPGQKRN